MFQLYDSIVILVESREDNLADAFRIHLEQISQDFQRLESRLRSLERENGDLKSGKPRDRAGTGAVMGEMVVFQGDRPEDTLENQFQEAFGQNYQNKLPPNESPVSVKYQKTKTISRSNSGDLMGS